MLIWVSCFVYSNGMEVFSKHPRNIEMKRELLDVLPEENMNAVSFEFSQKIITRKLPFINILHMFCKF